jgi:hypothetical protein
LDSRETRKSIRCERVVSREKKDRSVSISCEAKVGAWKGAELRIGRRFVIVFAVMGWPDESELMGTLLLRVFRSAILSGEVMASCPDPSDKEVWLLSKGFSARTFKAYKSL